MPSKLQFYQAVSEQAAKEVTAKRGNWTDFLDTAAKLYKYSFPDQLLIHAQRPDAIACAPIETWNDSFNRWVRRGTKGVALIDDTGSYPKLKYVFDVNDTEASLYNSRPVYLWEMRQEHREPVLTYLAGVYDDVDDTLADSFNNIARQLAHEYYVDNAREIRFCAEESFLEDFDDYNLGVAFENALTNSIAYTLMSRCGFDTAEHFEDEDFQYIFDFNTPDMVHALGTATNELSAQVLRDIELVIKKYERIQTAERSVKNERSTDIHTSRGLSSAGHQTERTAEGIGGTARTIRENEENISERPPDNTVQLNASERNTVPAPSGNRGSGENEVRASDEIIDGREPAARQGERPDGLDGGDERLEITSGGNGLESTDLHVKENQEKGAANETAPFSIEEQAQIHSDWHKRFVDAVLTDKAVIDTAAIGDKENTITAVRAVIDRICLDIVNEISDSPAILNKMEMFTELENYFADKTPNLENYIYDTVVVSDSNKEQLAENKPITEQEEIKSPSEQGGVFNVNETLSQVGTRAGRSADAELLAQASRLAEAISTSSVTVDEVDSILRDGGNDDKSVLRIAAFFSKNLTPEENTAFLRREYLMGRWGRREETPGGKGYQFGVQQTSLWFDETGITIGRGKSAIYASDRAHLTWEQTAERVKALYDAGQYVSHDVLDEALYNESKERADDVIEVYQNISRGLSDIQSELKKAMTKEQKEAVKDDWKIHRYLINGISELDDTVDELINGNDSAAPADVMTLYNESIRMSEEIPQEWLFDKLHPAMDERMTELLRDKGNISESEINQGIGYSELSEFALIKNRLREDIAELDNEPNAPIRFYRNPRRLLNDLERAGLPAHGFPIAEYQPLNYMRFITNDEVDRYLSRGGHYSEGKLRMLSHFLQEHTPKERQEFLKNEYGHGGGTWVGGGWYNAEPGKGINLKRPGCEDINLNWNQALRRTEELIKSGRFASRSELDNIPNYERLMLARTINNFYYNLSEEEYKRPFDKSLDFHYAKEDEWAALNDFLGDTERIDGVLAQMQYIFVNTPEEDRNYSCRKAGFENLAAFREGTYTLFPGIENLPDPERAVMRPSMRPISDIQSQRNTPDFSQPATTGNQLSLFDFENFTTLPSVEEQQIKIEQIVEPKAEAIAPAVSLPITQDEIDSLLLTISDEEKAQLVAQFADNPRSKEAVRLVREIYGGIEETLPRLNGESGYIWILGENTGVAIIGAQPFRNPKNEPEPAETITLPWAAVIKRISELAESGQLAVTEHEPTLYEEYQHTKAEYPDSVVFFQVGEFFELYNEDADIAAQVLDITVISREVGLSEPVRMAGIPFDMMPDYIDNVYQAGYSITLSSLNTDGSRSALNIPLEENEQVTEVAAENEIAEPEKEVETELLYKIGDRLEYNGKSHEIDQIGDFIRLHNLGTPSAYPIFDYINIPKQNFERMLSDGEIAITAVQEAATETIELDFDTVAQTVFERVMQDAEFTNALNEAQGRGALRRPLNTALEIAVYEHQEDEPQVYQAYINDDEFNDKLFDFVYRHSWEVRQQREAETLIQTEQTAKPNAERLLRQDGKDFYLFHFPEINESPAALSVDTLSLITEKADKYIICADVCYLSEEDMTGWGIEFRKIPRDFGMLPEIIQERIAAIRPDLAEAGLITQIRDELLERGYAVSDELINDGISDHRGRGNKDNFKDIADYIEAAALTEEPEHDVVENADIPTTSQSMLKPLMITSPPVFFVDWDKAQHDFNLNFYNDHDIVGYDKNGVEYAIGRSGNLTYVTSTGAFWGTNEVPGNIYEQITAYQNGELSDEQVRENYITVLESFKNFRAADLEKTHEELIDVLDNGIIADSEKITISGLLENGLSNVDLATMLSAAYASETSATVSLRNGDKADLKADSQGLEIIIPEKLHYVSEWTVIAPIVRSLAQKWVVELENEQKPIEQDTAEIRRRAVQGDTVYYRNKPYIVDAISDFDVRLFDPNVAFPVKMSVFIREFDDILASDPRNAHFLPLQTESENEKPQDPVNLRPSAIVESILSPTAEVSRIYDAYNAIKDGHAKHEAITLESYQERHTANGVDALLLRDLLTGDSDPQFIPGGAFYERERDGVKFPHFVVYDLDLTRQKIIEAGYLLKIDGKIEKPADRQAVTAAGVNFRITDDHLGEGGAKTKFRNNITAINTLHDIEFDKRAATPEEQEILSRYIGWGGLPQAFDPDNKQWTNEYLELNAALSPEEFESARASTLNAHYTSPTVIKAMYEAVERMGFKSGNILEPSCGVGNFFGLLPESMKQSKLYGVELDSVTARIAKQLYPKANIKEMGYEKTDTPDAFFDLAIGNVPFGNFGVVDKRYVKHNFSIHDYFFAKTLDQVRPGGVIAFITSKFTLDKQNPDVRKYIAQRAELLGAVRLPNDAFLKNAGTETTMDILFLQKRDRPMDIEPDWVHLGMTEDGLPVNRYYLDNPEMLLGKMALDEHMNNKYGRNDVTACLPIEGADLAEQLKTALLNIQGKYTVEELDDIEGIDNHAIPADPTVKNFSYTVVDDTVYFRENSLMYPVDLPATTLERIKGMIALRDCVHELIALQLDDYGEDEIKAKQAELSTLYDQFYGTYGLINSQGNNRAFSADNAYYLLCSLEILDEDGKLERKADMFTKRTIKQRTVITHVDTASEALAVSLGERACVDMDFMAELTGFTPEKIIQDLDGVIFFDFGNPNRSLPNFDPEKMKLYEKFPLVTADEYLSGNVREKLAKAIRFNETVGDEICGVDTTMNIKALEAAQPKDLEASEISVRLGSTWIKPEYVQQFMYELLNTNWRNRETYQVKYHQITGEWQVTGKNKGIYSDIHATVTYGTSRMNAYQIIDDTLNLRDVRVYDYKRDADGNEKRELNKKETTLAQQKQEQIKQAFKDWLWQDPTRRQTLVKEYNEKFNSVRPREYDGSHLTFSGISPEITMRQHQLNAIAHNLYGGNTLLAHVVGAGKTFEMVGMAMESKRLGLCNKSLLAVPNHLTEQWAGEFLRLYPSANILVATKKDFEMRNRKKFCAKIATGDYDAVIIGHSQLEKIPMSRERQERLLNEQLWEVQEGIRELKDSNGERFSIKQLEKTKKNLETRLAKLLDGKKRDDVVTFEQLGVDRLFVDEAHGFKNLFLYTKMRNVAGLSTSEAQKSSDLFMKCRYMDELTDNKGIIFATGTPISNSMTEMYTLQRYLQYDSLVAKNLTHFDCWASIFGETQTSIELAPEGTGYRARTRFAQFHNLPELICYRGSLK